MTTRRDWELVIVDNGSTDETGPYLATMSGRRFDTARVVTAFEPKRGLAAARNTGWRLAAGEIVGFTDDDCYASEDYVDSLIQAFDDDLSTSFVGGRILLFDPSDYKITIEESQERRSFQPWTFAAAGSIHGANFAFRRGVLERIGGFDERLGAGTPFPIEDIDAVAAALWSGSAGVYDPKPLVYHHHGRKTESEVRELKRGYDAGRGAYFTKYILKKASRAEYLKAWSRSIRDDAVGALRRGRLPGQSLRELSSGVRFAMRRNTGL